MHVDYNLKAQIIDCGLSKIYSQFSKACFQLDKMISDTNYDPYIKGVKFRSLKYSYLIRQIETLQEHSLSNWGVDLTNTNDYLVLEAQRINDSNYRKVKRLKQRIIKLLDKPCLFLTLTFTDSSFIKFNYDEKKLHNKVVRYLKSLGCQISYIGNVDYGETKDRLHYHALVQLDRIDPYGWKYGNLDFIKVYNKNNTAMAKYICKLTNHAIKETCKDLELSGLYLEYITLQPLQVSLIA